MSELRCLIIDFRKIFADFCLKKEKRGDFAKFLFLFVGGSEYFRNFAARLSRAR